MKNILWFKEINKEMVPIVGGKGANLGEMIKEFPIPNGFVITSGAYAKSMGVLLKKINELESNINVNNTKELNAKSDEIKNIILKSDFDKELEKEIIENYKLLGKNVYVAVRSSATAEDLPDASFAGQQDTYLNIKGKKQL